MTDRLRRSICLILTFVLTANPLLASAGGMAEDPAAPKGRKPGLTAAPNGVPMVNIARPDGRGLSHNMFDTFNVGKAGAILNNSRKAGRSQLGGVIANNPNLGSGPEARVILNEVTGSSRSRLEGYTEIFGRAADYILANPNGITINGGGFINTPKVTLTTGSPGFDQAGALRTLDVRRGDVRIDGDGLNAANLDNFDIVSRSAEINAAMHARNLGISTGYGTHDLATGEFSPLEPDGSGRPEVAIDSSALGGIYAERIKLVGNEKGVGVNLDGVIRATDRLVLTADGKIRIRGSVSSDCDLSVTSRGDGVDISGSLASGASAVVKAATGVTLAADSGGEAPLLYAKDASIDASALDNRGRILVDSRLRIDVKGDVENSNVMFSGEGTAIAAAGSMRNPGQVLSEGDVALNVRDTLDNRGRIHAGADGEVRAGAIDNQGDILSVGPMVVHSVRDTVNRGAITTEGHLAVEADRLTNSGRVTSGRSQDIAATSSIDNSGTFQSSADILLRGKELLNGMGGLLLSLGRLSMEIEDALLNLGDLQAGGGITVRSGGSLVNSGGVQAQSGMEFTSIAGMVNEGRMHSGGGGSFQTAGNLLNSGEILTMGELLCSGSGDMSNTGTLHAGGSIRLDLRGGLDNSGDLLSHDDMILAMSGTLTNFGTMSSNGGTAISVGGALLNAAGAEILAVGAASFDVAEALENSGRMEFDGPASFSIDSRLINDEHGSVLSAGGLDFHVQNALENKGLLHSGGSLVLRAADLHNEGRVMTQGDSAVTIDHDAVNSGLIFTGGTATVSLQGILHNIRGQIVSVRDMLLEGLGLGHWMSELRNDSGTIETLEGGMSIRAKVFRNANPDFALARGEKVIRTKGGIYSYYSDNWDQARDLYKTLPGSGQVASQRDALIITPTELKVLGLGTDRNVFPREELDEAIASAEKRFADSGGTSAERSAVANLKSRLKSLGIKMAIQHYKSKSKVAAYVETIRRDEAVGLEAGGSVMAAGNMKIEADSFINSVSRISTATGDITIDTVSFENAGHDICEHRTVHWARGHANEQSSPRLAKEGGGVETVSTPIGHAYGTISAGGKVIISAEHADNGISENAGMAGNGLGNISYTGGVGPHGRVVAPPKPESLSQSVGHIDDLASALPKDGLFRINSAPGLRYLVETDPALTSMARFYGSDYFLSRTGINLNTTQQQLLGDAFFETRLVRDQIFALTGRRFLSTSISKDSEQMLALMDNAVAAREDLNLSVGVALSAEQAAALTSDIVWLETHVVQGREVLVPVVYLCRGSLDTIARGGSVIIGRDAQLHASGDIANRGVIQATGELAVTAKNIFNSFGTLQGGTVKLAAVESLYNTSGLIKGGDISITAGQDIISGTAKTTFSLSETTRGGFAFRGPALKSPTLLGPATTVQTTTETVGRRGSIEATGGLNMQAGRDIGIVGSDVLAGGDISMEAGRNVVVTAQGLESHSSSKTGSFRSHYDTQTSKASTVQAGGSLRIDAGHDVMVHGSTVSAGRDIDIGAGRDVSVTAAADGFGYFLKQKSKGGMFSSSRSERHEGKVTNSKGSGITAGGDVNVEAGRGGFGDLTIEGSAIRSGANMNLKAAGDVLVVSARNEASHSSKSSESGLLKKKSSSLQTYDATVAKSELQAGGNIRIESGTAGDGIFVRSSDIKAQGDVELKSASDMLVTADHEQSHRHRQSSDSGFASLTPSMEMRIRQRSTTAGSEITAGGKVTLEARKNVAVQAATINSGGPASIVAAEGQVALLTGRDATYDQKVTHKTGLVTWKSKDKGQAAEIVVPTIIKTGQGLSITAGNGIVVEYKQTGDFRRDVELLAKNPGLEWMGTLLQRDDIDWQGVQDSFKEWSKSNSGLAPVATLVIAITVAALTSGAASELALSVLGLETSTLTGAVVLAGTQVQATAVQLAMWKALHAAFATIASRVAVSTADAAAGGDLGKNLESLVSEDSLRSLLSAMVTAGVLSANTSTFATAGPAGEILANTAVKTITSTLIGGEELEGAFLTALASSFASYAKSEISAGDLDDAVNMIIAGAAGAACAAALGQDPVQGAMSAIVTEMANTYLAPELTAEQKKRDGPMIRLANCNYENCMETDGYKLLSDDKLIKSRINPAELRDDQSGYSARIYHNEELNDYVIVFTGTNEAKDWGTNFKQAFGLVGDQYRQAGDERVIDKLFSLSRSTGGTLSATGHSLGGGMATAVASTGKIDRAVVFNTAGVHEKTIAAIGGRIETARAVTTAYASRADILNNLQDTLSLPSALGTRFIVEAGGMHGIKALAKAFEPK